MRTCTVAPRVGTGRGDAERRTVLDELELGMEPSGRRQLRVDALRDAGENLGRFACGCDRDDRRADVTAFSHRGHQRHLAQERYLEQLSKLCSAATAEQLVAGAVVSGEPRHVLDDALHL